MSGVYQTGGGGDDLLAEAETIKVCDQVAQDYQREIGKYKIRVSSSEVLDGIFEECKVPLEKRYALLKVL